MILQRKAYRAVVTGLKKIKEDWLMDRKENPGAIPYDISPQLDLLIEKEHRAVSHRRIQPGELEQVKEYLLKRNLIVPYAGGYAFSDTPLPSADDIIRIAKAYLEKL